MAASTLTPEQREALERHHDWLIATASHAVATLRKIPAADRDNYAIELIAYWRHAIRVAKWSRTFIGKNLKAGVKDATI